MHSYSLEGIFITVWFSKQAALFILQL